MSASQKQRDFYWQTRAIPLLLALLCGPVTAETLPKAAIASAHPLASEAGQSILSAGGNAFDAAVAVAAALAVVEPMNSGLGGGGFWLLHRAADGYRTMIDGRETAPLSAGKTLYLGKDGSPNPALSIEGPLAAAIPGSVAAMAHIATHYGKLPLKSSLAPAIRYARTGFTSGPAYQRTAKIRLQALRSSPAAAAIFLRNNEAPEPGSLIVQTDLADTLELIARDGAAGFYQGELAKRLLAGVNAAGGIWRAEDLLSYRVKEREPIRGQYRGLTITSAAPPSSGGIAILTMLNILSGYDLATVDTLTRTHLIVEAMRRAYRDRALYLGDPDYVKLPQQRLTHPDYAAGLRASLRPDKATASENLPGVEWPDQGSDTTHFSIVDKEGNRVAATLSLNYPFGACFVPPGTGVLLNDEMDDFTAKPGSANAYGLVGAAANTIAPGKRPLSSMSPTFIDTDTGFAILGTPGGSRIINMVLLAILAYADGQSAPEIVAAPRFHHQYLPDTLYFEAGQFDTFMEESLAELGHHPSAIDGRYGNMQVILWNRTRQILEAASDPRGEGAASVQ